MHKISFTIAKTRIKAIAFISVKLFWISKRNIREKPKLKPFEKTIIPEATKQKYVNPDINIKNKCVRSTSENLTSSTKQLESVSFCTKIEFI